MYDDRTNLAQQVTETLREYFKDRLFRTVIPRNVRLAEAPSHGKPVALYDPRSRGTEAYFELAGEFLARNQHRKPAQSLNAKPPHQHKHSVTAQRGPFLAILLSSRHYRLAQDDATAHRLKPANEIEAPADHVPD